MARLLMSFGPLMFLAVLMVVFTVMKPSFIDPINLFNILRQISITGLIALGMTFVILTAGIDLSVGSLLAFCGMIAAVVAKGGTANTLSLGDRRHLGLWLVRSTARRGRRRRCLWRRPGPGDHPAEGAALRRDAGRADGVPRPDADHLAMAARSPASTPRCAGSAPG